jgi:hypothetical protein
VEKVETNLYIDHSKLRDPSGLSAIVGSSCGTFHHNCKIGDRVEAATNSLPLHAIYSPVRGGRQERDRRNDRHRESHRGYDLTDLKGYHRGHLMPTPV